MAYNYTFDRTSKWDRGESLLTVDAFTCGNELRFINDYRDDLENFAEIERQRRRSNVEAMEVWRNGRPHIILVTRTAVAAMEELLVDYGDEYWESETAGESEPIISAMMRRLLAALACSLRSPSGDNNHNDPF